MSVASVCSIFFFFFFNSWQTYKNALLISQRLERYYYVNLEASVLDILTNLNFYFSEVWIVSSCAKDETRKGNVKKGHSFQ